jgi:hypothetical protein
LAALAASVVLAAGCASGDGGTGADAASEPSSTPSTLPGYVSDTYLEETNWFCLPDGPADACRATDLAATEIKRDLTTIDVPFEAAEAPAVDCFYLYPTLAGDGSTPNVTPASPRDTARTRVIDEAARFTSVCRVFAPWYPQSTSPPGATPSPEAEQIAYDAARDAFLHYLAQFNGGRPFALVGHGQGADLITRLVQDEVDTSPERLPLLLSAALVGSTRVFVPTDGVVGGSFQNVPLCTNRAQNGCAIAFQAFQVGVPPPSGGGPLYALVPPGMRSPCTNPAGLDGSKGQLRGSYFLASGPGLPPVSTPFALYREYYRGECATRSGASYLAIDTTTDPDDVRPLGPVESSPGQEAGLGLFDVEFEMALGDLIDLVETQAAARG